MRIAHFFILFCLIAACQSIPESQTTPKPSEKARSKDLVFMQDDLPILKQNSALPESEYKVLFDACGISDGCFVLHNLKHNAYTYYNRSTADIAVSPASTFKIFNSLVALETGAIQDTNTVLKWDGVWREVKVWNQNHTMKTAFKCSAVWFYQELARRIGEKKMKAYLKKAHYGNGNISGEIDQFWLSGDLKISPMEQIMFLEKLYKEVGLPFSHENQQKVKSIMIETENEKGILRTKTGWGVLRKEKEAENIGWYVGYIEKKHNQYFFALCIHAKGEARDDFASCRKEIALKILKKLEIWE
jgi:beta-lactamase class D